MNDFDIMVNYICVKCPKKSSSCTHIGILEETCPIHKDLKQQYKHKEEESCATFKKQYKQG